MFTQHPQRSFGSLTIRLAWPLALVALIAATIYAVSAAAEPLDPDATAAQPTQVAPADEVPVDAIDVSEFDAAIESATDDADEAARLAAWVEAERIAAAEEAAWLAAVAEAERATEALRFHGGLSDAGLAALRACESSGNYGAVSSSGSYRGAYQFSQQTWNSVASRHHSWLVGVDPATAAPADQDAQARALYAMSGPGQWPHCGRNL
jgi:hypothetical protein